MAMLECGVSLELVALSRAVAEGARIIARDHAEIEPFSPEYLALMEELRTPLWKKHIERLDRRHVVHAMEDVVIPRAAAPVDAPQPSKL